MGDKPTIAYQFEDLNSRRRCELSGEAHVRAVTSLARPCEVYFNLNKKAKLGHRDRIGYIRAANGEVDEEKNPIF
eukprot:scaffold546295_cov13-Prasinocladus_malaysianus.AAC.1